MRPPSSVELTRRRTHRHATAKDPARAFKGFLPLIISGAFFLQGMSIVNFGQANRMGKCRTAAELPFSEVPALNSDSTECTRYVLSTTILFFGAVGLEFGGYAGVAFSPKRSNSFAIAGGAFGLGKCKAAHAGNTRQA